MDEKVFRFVAHTGFTHFEKGILWHERMYVLSSAFPAPLSLPLKRATNPPFDLTATNFWERVSSTRAFFNIDAFF